MLEYFDNDIDHIEPFARRGFHFACVKRLQFALEELLQALFITRRIYPISYVKHTEEQVVEILGVPALYPRLIAVVEMPHLDADTLIRKAALLADLMAEYVRDPPPTTPG